ncbi:Cof-type HAD-IIB family hydrolase [Barrientosiimonas marina]|uniref:Cof-type HAD-IIB family hydrolase n=1 Tax=Lentibacillus kimchii TaxID=1542911 RepID=A0ABW2UTB2_9BACI
MEQKLIFFDIDGTLLNDNKELPAATIQAIEELQAAGHFVAIATGRAPFAFEAILTKLHIHTYVGINGQYVVHNNDVIYKNPLKSDDLAELEAYATKREHPLVHLSDTDWYANTRHHPRINEAIDSLKIDQPLKYQPDFYREGDVYQTLLFCTEDDEATYRQTFDQLEFVRWHPYSMDVMPAGGSKAAGIQKLIQELDVPSADIYAFGDGLNDIPMLQAVQNSIAMGNASDIVKQAAKQVTRDVNEDGLWHGLKMAGLL